MNTPRILLALALALAAGLLGLAHPAAASQFSARVFADGALGDFAQGPAPVQVSAVGPDANASAGAGGVLRGDAHAQTQSSGSLNNTSRQAGANTVEGIYDDIILTGPTAFVQSTLHLAFHGAFRDRREVWFGDFEFHSNVTSFTFFSASLNNVGGSPGGSVQIDFDAFNATQVITPTGTAAASAAYRVVFADFLLPLTCGNGCPFGGFEGVEDVGFSGTIDITGVFPTNTPLILQMDMQFSITASSFFLSSGGGTLDLNHTFGVLQNGQPVFDLPPGFTANSVSLGIVDNVVPGAEGPSSGVPAPASLAMVILGALLALPLCARVSACARGRSM